MTQQEIDQILYFQKWHMEYSKAAMFHREIGETNRAKYFQSQAAEQFRMVCLYRYGTTLNREY